MMCRPASFNHAHLANVCPQIETLLKSHKLVNVHFDRVVGVS
jgi:hypothetical protein